MGWRKKPTSIDECPNNIDYILFVDENGSDDLKYIKKCVKKDKQVDVGNKIFTTTGCIIEKNELSTIKSNISKLKNKYWENGTFLYDGEIRRVCFHSREIRRREGPFFFSDDEIYKNFIDNLTNFLISINTSIISIHIDKMKHYQKYLSADSPYNITSSFLLERFVFFLEETQSKGIVVLEKRGDKEDVMLLNTIKNIYQYGNNYVEGKRISNVIKGIYFNSKWCHKYSYPKTYFGLEIADLLSHPMHIYARNNQKNSAFLAIENKLRGFPEYYGRGYKIFP